MYLTPQTIFPNSYEYFMTLYNKPFLWEGAISSELFLQRINLHQHKIPAQLMSLISKPARTEPKPHISKIQHF